MAIKRCFLWKIRRRHLFSIFIFVFLFFSYFIVIFVTSRLQFCIYKIWVQKLAISGNVWNFDEMVFHKAFWVFLHIFIIWAQNLRIHHGRSLFWCQFGLDYCTDWLFWTFIFCNILAFINNIDNIWLCRRWSYFIRLSHILI